MRIIKFLLATIMMFVGITAQAASEVTEANVRHQDSHYQHQERAGRYRNILRPERSPRDSAHQRTVHRQWP